MSAPTSGSSGSSSAASPVPGYYPDPSVPHYIRYWNGSAWVPGTSRPAPIGDEEFPPPPVAQVPAQAPVRPQAPAPAVDESGPMFLDEDPRAPLVQRPALGPAVDESGPVYLDEGPRAQPAQRPGPPATAWPAPARPGAELPRISWGAPGAPATSARPPARRPPAARQPQAMPQPVPLPPAVPRPQRQLQPQPQPQPAAAPWAAQVRDLARQSGGEPVVPWRPPAADPFASMQAQDRPGGLLRRFAARVVDTVLWGAVVALAAVPLGTAAYHHAKDKVDEAKLTGETVKVWLIDGTTGTQLGAVLAVAIVAGLLLEVLPTAKWGRTLGKRLVGLRVLDVEAQLPPDFGASLRRWLTHFVLDLLVVGVAGLAWCLFDRPWKQCWHDKAARTFVAGG